MESQQRARYGMERRSETEGGTAIKNEEKKIKREEKESNSRGEGGREARSQCPVEQRVGIQGGETRIFR